MTDYTKNASFTAKTGQTIQGADFDSEFDEIATAVASKQDTSAKGAANGYCGLDASGLVDATDLPATVVYSDAVGTFDEGLGVQAAAPYLFLKETGVTANNGYWRVLADAETFYMGAANDAWGSFSNFMQVDRTALAIDTVTIGGTTVALNGNGTVSGSLTVTGAIVANGGMSAAYLTSGTLPDARIAVTGVTQHQASLSIQETQIADGTVFPRRASSETITGSWSFDGISAVVTGTLVKSAKGAYPYFDSATQSSGAITVSTAAASGTPAAGDLWIQYTA